MYQNEIVTTVIGKRADKWITDLIPMSHAYQNSSIDYMQVSITTLGNTCPNHDFITSVSMCFDCVGFLVSGALFSPD